MVGIHNVTRSAKRTQNINDCAHYVQHLAQIRQPSSWHVLPLTETEIPYQAFARMRPARQMPTLCTHSLSMRDLIVTPSAFFKLTPTPRIAVEPRMALSPDLGDDAHLNNMA